MLIPIAFALLAFDIDPEECAWEIADAAHFHDLAWKADTGEEWLIGTFPQPNQTVVVDPIFLRPAVQQGWNEGGGVGHAVALRRCSPYFAGIGGGARFSVVWDPKTELFLATFDVYVTLEEVLNALDLLQRKFHAGLLHYWPRSYQQIVEAESWPPGAIPLVMSLEERRYVPYALGVTYGRLRLVSVEDWPHLHEEGSLTRQDLLLLQEAPLDFDVRVAGAITCIPQGPLSHVNLICLQEGTPNAYVAGAWDIFAPYADTLVRLEVRETRYAVREATLEEAELFWAARRPAPLEISEPDLAFRDMSSIDELAGTYDPQRFGGKGAHLARFLPAIPAEQRVPAFVIPFAYFREYLETNRVGDVSFAEMLMLLWRDERFRTDSRYRREALDAFRLAVEDQGRVAGETVRQIAARIQDVFGSTALKVRFRSSSNAEDALLFPGAGLYDSYSACADDSLDRDGNGPCLCDPAEVNERTIERALRKVWASLWNFRAVEQRLWHGITEERVCMGILVTPAFLTEAANGVALTGSPTDPDDGRYFVTSQLGEESVVRPDPGSVPEVDLITARGDGTLAIERLRPSSMLPPGEFVMSEAELASLGAALRSLAQSYQPPPPFPPELVRLDVEFKVNPDRRVSIKQVRPYCVPGAAKLLSMLEPRPFDFPCPVLVNAATGSDGVFLEWERRSVVRLRGASFVLSLTDESTRAPWIDSVVAAAGAEPYLPLDEAENLRTIDFRKWVDGIVSFQWTIEQALGRPSGGEIRVRADRLSLRMNLWEPVEPTFAWDGVVQAIEDGKVTARYLPIAGGRFPSYRLAIDLAGGEYLDILLDAPSSQSVADGVVLGAQGSVGGTTFFVDDPFALAVGDGPRPVRNAFLIVVGQEGLAALLVEFRLGETAPFVVVLDEEFRAIDEPEVAAWSRRLFSLADSPKFMRGDVNGDGGIDVADAIGLLGALFGSGGTLACADAADADDNGRLNISDAITILRHLYATPSLIEACDFDPTDDALRACDYDPWRCLGAERAQDGR